MPSFVYAPGIEVHVESRDKIIDISEDLVSWSLTRRENAVSTFSFRLQNAQRKYDGRLLPMDRISVRLKRLSWVQAFTGYLNDGPIFQAWPGALDITASCSLKRLQFWYWDPGTAAVFNLIQSVLGSDSTGATKEEQASYAANQGYSHRGDRGLSNVIIKLLTDIPQWPQDKIHIGEIPADWYKFAAPVGNLIQKDTEVYHQLGGFAMNGVTATGGTTVSNSAIISPDSYGGVPYDTTQVGWASAIYEVIVINNKLPSFFATLALMCAIVESGLRNIASANVPASQALPHDTYPGASDGLGHDHASVGLFQQQTGTAWAVPPSETTISSANGWGTPAQLLDVSTSTQLFINSLKTHMTKKGGQWVDPTKSGASACAALIQDVQGSAPDAYAMAFPQAAAMVQALDAAARAGATPSKGDLGGKSIGTGTQTGTGTGPQIAATAIALINAHLPPVGQYMDYESDVNVQDPMNTPIQDVSKVDCSSLTNWVYYHTTGNPWPHSSENSRGPASGEQYSGCTVTTNSDPRFTYDLATRIQGAFLFGDANGNGHVGISLGNGEHVAAHDHYSDISQDVTRAPSRPPGDFHTAPQLGGLAPGIDYTAAANDSATAVTLSQILGKTVSVAPSLGKVVAPSVGAATVSSSPSTSNDAFQALLNSLVLPNSSLSATGLSNALGGRLALFNDQPMLPWLQNLINSSMRSFCSAPNGDFIAWFPDYFDIWKQSGIINIEPIELQDFVVRWSDQQIVTHQFVIGNSGNVGYLDLSSGNIGGTTGYDLQALAQNTAGIATMDYGEIFEVIYGQKASAEFLKEFLDRFGARPNVLQLPTIFGNGNRAEFFMALYTFMQAWAGQFTATIPVTFMPEAFPGMLVRIPAYGFQAYITEVTHSGSFGDGGTFQTEISIVAPASTVPSAQRGDLLSLLPNVGQPLHDSAPPADTSASTPKSGGTISSKAHAS